MSFVRSFIPKIVLSAIIVITILSYFLGIVPLSNGVSIVNQYVIIMIAFSLPLGVINLVGRNIKNIQNKRQDWLLDIAMLVSLTVMTVLGIFFGVTNTIYLWLYNNVNIPVGAMVMALTGLYIASAAYRSFRVRNLEGSLLLVSAIIIMLWNAPIGAALFPPILPIGNWFNNYPLTTGNRVIFIGFALGVISLCVRYIFFRENITGEST